MHEVEQNAAAIALKIVQIKLIKVFAFSFVIDKKIFVAFSPQANVNKCVIKNNLPERFSEGTDIDKFTE